MFDKALMVLGGLTLIVCILTFISNFLIPHIFILGVLNNKKNILIFIIFINFVIIIFFLIFALACVTFTQEMKSWLIENEETIKE